ncbi:MAG: hypothetical protein ACPGWR_00080 [Ardenticatenaceae bacterium]
MATNHQKKKKVVQEAKLLIRVTDSPPSLFRHTTRRMGKFWDLRFETATLNTLPT